MMRANKEKEIATIQISNEFIDELRQFTYIDSRLHGPAHWVRVHRFGTMLANSLNLSEREARCVEVFSFTHDLARIDDGGGNQHAIDGAIHAFKVMDAIFPDLDEAQQQLISAAIRYHSDGLRADEAYYRGFIEINEWSEDVLINTVGCCFDADRLDLLRLGVEPHERYMSTGYWADVLSYARRLHKRK